MDGPRPAILNAIENALGMRVDEIPLMPETLMEPDRSRRQRDAVPQPVSR